MPTIIKLGASQGIKGYGQVYATTIKATGTFSSHVFDAGSSDESVQYIMGYSNLKTDSSTGYVELYGSNTLTGESNYDGWTLINKVSAVKANKMNLDEMKTSSGYRYYKFKTYNAVSTCNTIGFVSLANSI